MPTKHAKPRNYLFGWFRTFLQNDIYIHLSNGKGFTIALRQDQELQGSGVVTHLLKKTDHRDEAVVDYIPVDKAAPQIHVHTCT